MAGPLCSWPISLGPTSTPFRRALLEATTQLGLSPPGAGLFPTPKPCHPNIRTDRSGPGSAGAGLTFKEGGTLLDVGPQLLKNAIDLLLGSDKVLEWRSIHLSHVSLILLDCDNGVASREEQGHRAVREETVSEPGTPSWALSGVRQGRQGRQGSGDQPRGHREHGLRDQSRAGRRSHISRGSKDLSGH